MDSDENETFPPYADYDLEGLETGITTRVLAERLRRQSQDSSVSERRESTPGGSRRSSRDERRPSKFLSGVSIPNSVIQSGLNVKEPPKKDAETLRKERDEQVAQIVQNFMPKFKQVYDEAIDIEAMAKIRKELQRRSSIVKENENKENQSRGSRQEESVIKTDSKEAVREKRRVSCRTESFKPLSSNKLSTLDSIRIAVENAKSSPETLINADELIPKPHGSIDSDQEISEPVPVTRQPSSFISRRKFVSKSEKAKGNRTKQPSIEILQPGINRPSVTFQMKESKTSRGEINEDEVTLLQFPSIRRMHETDKSQMSL